MLATNIVATAIVILSWLLCWYVDRVDRQQLISRRAYQLWVRVGIGGIVLGFAIMIVNNIVNLAL